MLCAIFALGSAFHNCRSVGVLTQSATAWITNSETRLLTEGRFCWGAEVDELTEGLLNRSFMLMENVGTPEQVGQHLWIKRH